MSKNKRIPYLKIWWYELANDLRAERRNKIEEFNKILLENGIITEIIDSFGRKIKSAPNAVDYFHAIFDKTGNIIDSDKHKEIRAIYSAKIFNRYFSLIMGTIGSVLGIIGGVLGILAYRLIKS
jgi:hypothetical protein